MTDNDERRGTDGLTPSERLEARGFELDDTGATVEIGYGGTEFESDPWAWFDQHDEACVLRCESTDDVVGRAWVTPDNSVWVRGTYWQGPLDGSQPGEPTNLLLYCPAHDAVLVPARWVEDQARSTRTVVVQCLDPYPVY